eukprot:CAMPEP_0173113524 /NCGR_PEP_ID=MMETSP1102-20130122/46920_1 /TAXON_ID=49646 /ORGANISM="Geminigera sp., Strain Caron Lab Isolate" /LENGTH=79 /DNA_ID=CAMNT_0014015313 /DNA_START=1421 /DNA_END=1657 /DNA_ORIENTATION=+
MPTRILPTLASTNRCECISIYNMRAPPVRNDLAPKTISFSTSTIVQHTVLPHTCKISPVLPFITFPTPLHSTRSATISP